MNVLNTSTHATIESTTAAISAPPNPLSSAIGIALRRAKVSIKFLTRDNNAVLIVSSGRILLAMTGNPHYPAPVPALADIVAARNAFIALVNAPTGGPAEVIARKQRRAQLVALLRSLALYVQQTCNGDPLVLLGSGYPKQKVRQPAGRLPAPVNLRLARGMVSGQLKARCNAIAHAGTYQWQYATAAAPAAWTLVNPTLAANIVFDGFVPGTVYIAQVRVVGSQGPSDWSDAASLMVV